MNTTRYWFRLALIIAIVLVVCVQGAVLAGDILPTDHEFIYTDAEHYVLTSVERGLQIALPELANIMSVSWTPDGEYITYFQDNAYSAMEVATQDIDSEVVFDDGITSTTWSPIWSSDGRHFIVEVYTPSGEFSIIAGLYLFTVDANYRITDVQRIFEGMSFFLAWSPDGNRVAFVESFSSTGTNSVVYIYDIISSSLTTHTIDSLSTFRVYWWDESHIVFVREDGIYRIDLTTDESTLLWDTGYNPLPARNHWQISPDLTRLIYDGGLYAVSEANTAVERINDIDSATEWSADSEYLLMLITHIGGSCAGTYCYPIVTLDLVLGDLDGNPMSEIASGLSIIYFNWRP